MSEHQQTQNRTLTSAFNTVSGAPAPYELTPRDIQKEQREEALIRVRDLDRDPNALGGLMVPINLSEDKINPEQNKKKNRDTHFMIRLMHMNRQQIIRELDKAIDKIGDLIKKSNELNHKIDRGIESMEETIKAITKRHEHIKHAIENETLTRDKDGRFESEAIQEQINTYERRTGEQIPNDADLTTLLIILQKQEEYDLNHGIPSLTKRLEYLYDLRTENQNAKEEMEKKQEDFQSRRAEILAMDDNQPEKDNMLRALYEEATDYEIKAAQELDEIEHRVDNLLIEVKQNRHMISMENEKTTEKDPYQNMTTKSANFDTDSFGDFGTMSNLPKPK